MGQQSFSFGALGTLLVLCLIAASSSGTKLKSSGINFLVTQDGVAHARSAKVFAHQRRDAQPQSNVHVRKFHMSSLLYARFARVTIESEMLNLADAGSQEVIFQVQVPEAAFMSNFTMVVDGRIHKSQVLEKMAAEKRYQEAQEKNLTAGRVRQEAVKLERGMELFTISINVAPQGTASFTLVYHELLKRRGGNYMQTLVVQPGAIVDDMKISASYAERQGFTSFAYTLPGSKHELTASSEDDKTQMKAGVNSRELVFRPTMEMQRKFDSEKGIYGEFLIIYRINIEPEGGSIIVQNEYFAHFFAPPDLNPLPKDILFVIDISGSMSGDKITQARQAMLKILEDLKARTTDKFNILLFDDNMVPWHEVSVNTSAQEINRAKDFVQKNLKSRGGTNIHQALMKGLELLVGDQKTRSCETADMIVFLTDGDPTSGVTSTSQIIGEVTAFNGDRASIYSLGFGFRMNFDFLTKISLQNRGFVRRIYAESDAKEQLRDFYREISAPVLCNVVAHYSTDVVDANQLSLNVFPLFFHGEEIVVAGKVKTSSLAQDTTKWNAELQGTGANGLLDFEVPAQKVQVITESFVADDLTEKLWAYMKIKSLLRKLDTLDSGAKRDQTHALALNMSLTYGFVTPLTSFSIVVETNRGSPELSDTMPAHTPSGGSFNVKRMGHDSVGGPTGHADTLRGSWGVVCTLFIALSLRL